MLKIPEAVRNIVLSSEVALSALNEDFLNFTSYAVSIKKEVEEITKKKVRIGSIVVALSRMKKSLPKSKELSPTVKVDHISIKRGLLEIAFDKTRGNLSKLKLLYSNDKKLEDYLLVSHGISEISIFTVENARNFVLKTFAVKPRAVVDKLASVTLRLGGNYINVPNVTHKFVRALAIKNICIVELVSTFTELTFMLHERDVDEAVKALNREIGS